MLELRANIKVDSKISKQGFALVREVGGKILKVDIRPKIQIHASGMQKIKICLKEII